MSFGLSGGLGQENMSLMLFSEADVALSCESKIIGNAFGGYYDPEAFGPNNVSKMSI